MSLFPIFKVKKVYKEKVELILVFYGKNIDIKEGESKREGIGEDENIQELFDSDPTNIMFLDIFNKYELDKINTDKIHVIFLEQSIHIDDSIGVIKLKICEALKMSKEPPISFEEIYLFYLKSIKLNPITIYQKLTNNDQIKLNRNKLDQVLSNLYDINEEPLKIELPISDTYTFDDILGLNLDEIDYVVSLNLGNTSIYSTDYPFIANPYRVTGYDSILEKYKKDMVTFSSTSLLESGNIHNNTIYLCTAEDVYGFNENEFTSKIYFPLLYNDNVLDIDELKSKQDTYITKTNNKLTKDVLLGFETINTFYNIFNHRTDSSKFTEEISKSGIKSIKIRILPDFKFKIPIDIIFRLLHATESSPLIKYNPDSKFENIYRLYVDNVSEDGRKIPYLNKAIINILMRDIGKSKSVAVYTNTVINSIEYKMVCEFYDNGSIHIYSQGEFGKPILLNRTGNPFQSINELFILSANPIIEQVKSFFEQSGLKINIFEDILSDNVELLDMNLHLQYTISEPIQLKKNKFCLSHFLNIETEDLKKGTEMRYKRVSNFNKRDSQEAFIIDKMHQGKSTESIIKDLVDNYTDISNIDEAREIMDGLINELNRTRGINKLQKLMKNINPGFKTNMIIINSLDKTNTYLSITIHGINNIRYIDSILVYMDTFVRLYQDIDSSNVSKKYITKLCKGQSIITDEILFIEDPQNKPTELDMSPENLLIIDENVDVNEKIEDEIDLQNMEFYNLMNSDEDETNESSISETGGDGSSASGESLPVSPESIVEDSLPVSPESIVEESSKSLSLPLSQETIVKEINIPLESDEESGSESESKSESETSDIEEVEPRTNVITNKPILKPTQILKTKTVGEKEPIIRDIVGLKIANPNPISERLKRRVPELFIKAKNEKIDLFSRMCQSNKRRQPIILTEEEKTDIIQNNPGEIDTENDFLKYSSDPSDPTKTYYYTCPQYWCLLTNKVVTSKDILAGKCGPRVEKVEDAIIPATEKKVPRDKYVMKLYDDKDKQYPGFHKNTTENGLCIPCCFKKLTEYQNKRRNICQGTIQEKGQQKIKNKKDKKGESNESQDQEDIDDDHDKSREEIGKAKVESTRVIYEKEQYIIASEKYPLGENRLGFLPLSIQYFFKDMNVKCQTNESMPTLKLDTACLLRQGVENNPYQSFIACLASAMFYAQVDEVTKKPLILNFLSNAKTTVPSISEMKQIILNALTLDHFIKYQNGDLITIFANPEANINIETPEYTKTQLYKKIVNNNNNNTSDSNDNNKLDFLTKVIQSYENFQKYMKDDTNEIDYTYLWDIVCDYNPKLFAGGLNLIIFEIPEDDQTMNVNLVCPTNHYSRHIFNARKRTLFLIRRENYFEPIYVHKKTDKVKKVTTTFSIYDHMINSNIKIILNKMSSLFKQKCNPLSSKPVSEYRFNQSPLLDDLIKQLQKKKYNIQTQVLNFQGKVIGLLVVSSTKKKGYVPCFPSALTNIVDNTDTNCKTDDCKYDYVYMTDDIWQSYENTLKFLEEYYLFFKNEPTKKKQSYHFFKMIENNVVVGFITDTNQFISIDPPKPITEINDNIPNIENNNILEADINTQLDTKYDTDRVEFIKKIQLETNYYNVFRNTIRILLNDYSNSKLKNKLKEESNKKYIIHTDHVQQVSEILRELVSDHIVFASTKKKEFDYKKVDENNIHTCLQSIDKCTDNDMVCRISSDNTKCVLILPKENLLTDSDNELLYYNKMADELIRYNRIKSFIFKPQSYLSFGQIKYNLQDNEIIILQDLLTTEFFEGLVPSNKNKYSRYNTYDTTKPLMSLTYENTVDIDKDLTSETECVIETFDKIKIKKWRECFPSSFKEIEYGGSNTCGFKLIQSLIKLFHKTDISLENIKTRLIEEYNKLISIDKDNLNKIISILKEQGNSRTLKLHQGIETIDEMINDIEYYLVNFDLWLLLESYKIPSIFISNSHLPDKKSPYFEFVSYKSIDNNDNNDNRYVFIITPGLYTDENHKYPEYKVVIDSDNNMDIDLNTLNTGECFDNVHRSMELYYDVETYIRSYKKKSKKIQRLVIIKGDIEDEGEGENEGKGEIINKEEVIPIPEEPIP